LTDEVITATQRGPLLIVTRRRYEAKLRAAGVPLHEWSDTGRHVLYGTIAPPSTPASATNAADARGAADLAAGGRRR
jgi:hypothetical protein